MQIQKIKSNQTTFGVQVKFMPETEAMLLKKGKNMYYTYFERANNLMYWQNDKSSIMIISHTRKPHKMTNLVANLYKIDGEKVLASQSSVQRPIYRTGKDGRKYIADLYDMYNELKVKLTELKDLHYNYKLFKKSKG